MLGQRMAQLVEDAADQPALGRTQEGQACEDAVTGVGIQLGEGEVFQLVLHLVDSDALGKRCVDLERLAGDPLPLLGVPQIRQGAHVVDAVGQLDQQDPDVLRHGKHQLAEVFRLLGLVGLCLDVLKLDPRQLGDAVDEASDIGPEQALHILQRRDGVLDRVVQQGRHDRSAVQLHLGEDAGDFQRMGEVGVAVGPRL